VSGLGCFTHWKDPLYSWKLAGPWSWSEHFGEEKISCPAWFQALGHPACSLVIILTTPSHSENVKLDLCTPSYCCILREPIGERILDVVPRGTELGTQVKMGSRAGCTLSNPQVECTGILLGVIRG